VPLASMSHGEPEGVVVSEGGTAVGPPLVMAVAVQEAGEVSPQPHAPRSAAQQSIGLHHCATAARRVPTLCPPAQGNAQVGGEQVDGEATNAVCTPPCTPTRPHARALARQTRVSLLAGDRRAPARG